MNFSIITAKVSCFLLVQGGGRFSRSFLLQLLPGRMLSKKSIKALQRVKENFILVD